MTLASPLNSICIAISQSSRRFALIDILNAADQCDLMEIRLDRFSQTPDVKQLLEACTKPTIISCRRRQDGGEWSGADSPRLALLRQAVLEGASFVEIELDCVEEIRRYGSTQRIVSYSNLDRVPQNLAEIYAKAAAADPDIIKLALAPASLDELRLTLQVLKSATIPTVVVGWHQSHLFFDILLRRWGTPWTYVALEKGLEAHPGLPTLTEAIEWLDLKGITDQTPLFGIVGRGQETEIVTAAMNRLFRAVGSAIRCLPIEVPCPLSALADLDEWLPLSGLFFLNPINPQAGGDAKPNGIATADDWARDEGVADLFLKTPQGWKAHSTLFPALLEEHEERIRKRFPVERPLVGRTFLIVGAEPFGQAIGRRVAQGGAEIVWTDVQAERAQNVASQIGGKSVPANKTGSVFRHGLIVCKQCENGEGVLEISTSREREETYAIDLSMYPLSTRLLRNVASHGGLVISNKDVFRRQITSIVTTILGSAPSQGMVAEALAGFDFD